MTAVEFGLLGPLVVYCGPRAVPVRAGKQRALLAALLLDANRAVTTGELAEVLWGMAPPRSAAVTIRNYVKRLRQALGEEERDRLSTQQGGYLLRLESGELDVSRFEALVQSAHAAARSGLWDRAALAAQAALVLWRGEPLADIESEAPKLREAIFRLGELRVQAREVRICAELNLGRHAEVIAELQQLATAFPLRERLHGLLMLALYRSGRQGDALAAYRQARTVLVDELATEPAPELQHLHQQILTADPALMAPEPVAGAEAAAVPVTESAGAANSVAAAPRQLPGSVPHFTGRAAELAELSQILDQAVGQAPETVVISAIGGMAGVGKTALAVHWAHRVAHRFPDGQLYVNLGGFGPPGSVVTPAEAICGFLGALGVPADQVPTGLVAQAALYRSTMAARQMLVVLDNARDEQQVRPLLPGSPGCLVVVTSRSQLAGLAAAEDASLLSLDVLPATDARLMLAARLGPQRTAAEPGAVTEITRLSRGLPLALAVAAARAAAHPQLPLPGLAAELRDAQRCLDTLDTGDPATSVRAVFSWSCQHLTPAAARMFRLLGLHPGPDVTAPAAASLTAVAPARASQALGQLTRAHLLTEPSPGRYGFHDLLRAYASEQACLAEDEPTRRAAIGRVLDHYLHTAYQAALLLDPQRDTIPLATPLPGAFASQLTSAHDARAWFDAEHRVLSASVRLAAKTGHDNHAWQLAWALADYLHRLGRWQDLSSVQHTALAAAIRLGDPGAQAVTYRLTARTLRKLGSYDDARDYLMKALSLYQQASDRVGEARAHQVLSLLLDSQSRFAEALHHDEQALSLFQAAGHRTGQAQMLNAVGFGHIQLGHPDQGRSYCEQALDLCQQLGDLVGEAHTWHSLGYADHQLGQHHQAADKYDRALSIYRELGTRDREAEALADLGDTRHASGEHQKAKSAWQQALAIFEDLQDPHADTIRARLDSDSDTGKPS